jgi:uncharacterized repeat protein (TIGR01451 family)
VKHALTVLAGIAAGLPVMAALASMDGHTAGGLPDRYAPWARSGHHIHTGFAPLRAPEPRRARLAGHGTFQRTRPRVPVSTPRAMRSQAPPGVPGRTPPWHPAGGTAGGYAEPTADLRVSIAAPRTVKRGGTYVYRVRLTNRGPGTPSEVTVHNVLPEGVVRTGTSLPGGVGGYAGGRDATLVMPRLAPGSSATVRFNVRVRPRVRGKLIARSRIAYIGGVRDPRRRDHTARVSTRVD